MNIVATHSEFTFAGSLLLVLVDTAPHFSTLNFVTDNDDSVESSTYLSSTEERHNSNALFDDYSITIYNSSTMHRVLQ
jgi:hypothetical protein